MSGRPAGPWRLAAGIGLGVGVALGAVMMAIAWDHNPQGAIHDGGRVSWGPWLAIGASWGLPAALGAGALAGLVLRGWPGSRRRGP